MGLRIEILSKKYVKKVADLESELIAHTSKESIEKTISSKTLFYFVLLQNEDVVGFLETSIIVPEIEILEIGIDKNFQGKGYSKLLMEHFFDYAKKQNCETVFLEVNSINTKAINLYKKYGFKEYGIRKKYYGDNDAILMKLMI